ncbi:MAG: hypothetical protein M1292_04385 [Bacteroidetes bacterium]|nr:hypothetical protein [Bacteroidota bacterium]
MKELSFENMEGIVGGLSAADYTIACTKSYYADYGWWSVSLAIASFVDPGIGITVIAACALSSLAQ